MSTVIVTGAAGFLGSHLCDRFIKEGYFVIGMDNLLTGNLANIEHLFKLKEFEFKYLNVIYQSKERKLYFQMIYKIP